MAGSLRPTSGESLRARPRRTYHWPPRWPRATPRRGRGASWASPAPWPWCAG